MVKTNKGKTKGFTLIFLTFENFLSSLHNFFRGFWDVRVTNFLPSIHGG